MISRGRLASSFVRLAFAEGASGDPRAHRVAEGLAALDNAGDGARKRAWPPPGRSEGQLVVDKRSASSAGDAQRPLLYPAKDAARPALRNVYRERFGQRSLEGKNW